MTRNQNVSDLELALTPRFGIIRMLSEQLYSDRAQPIIEYVKNAWDADASEVNISLTKDSLKISDNGKGMDLEALSKFLYIGESPSPKSGKTEKNRKCMGRWGVGNMAALAIGEGYKVTTVKKGTGEQIIYDINFKDLESGEKKDGVNFFDVKKSVKTKPAGLNDHETKIEIYGLNKNYRRAVNHLLELLKKDIGKKMPVRGKGFKVLLNGKEVPHYIDQFLKGARKTEMNFSVQDESGKSYTVNGWFKVAQRNLNVEDSGIYPVVNEEVFNKITGHQYGAESIKGFMSLKHRVYGEFEADFLANYLTTSRDRYKDEHHPLITQIYSKINEYMSGLVKQVDEDKKRELNEGLEDLLDESSVIVSKALDKAFNYKDGLFPPNEELVDPTKKGKSDGIEKRTKEYTGGGSGGGKKPSDKSEDNPKTHPNRPIAGTPEENYRNGRKFIEMGGHKFCLSYYNGGVKGPCVEVNAEGQETVINKDHPMFKKAKTQGRDTLGVYVNCSLIRALTDYKALVIDGQGIDTSNRLYNSAMKVIGEMKDVNLVR